ncbi:MAG TPA: Rid family detoxifying hydrolase [Desulfobacteria bacterium]|nr:Rid family detoxifying hydrolase [Desulfobacteria bacterium]
MGEKNVFHTDKAAVTGGPYAQAIIHDGLIYVSGQGAVDPETNEIRLGTVEEEAELALRNLKIILEEAGSSLKNTLKVTVYLLDMEEFARFNGVYRRYFGEHLPARTCIQAACLPFETRVEIDVIAHI